MSVRRKRGPQILEPKKISRDEKMTKPSKITYAMASLDEPDSAEWKEYIAKIKGKNRKFVCLKWKTHQLKFNNESLL